MAKNKKSKKGGFGGGTATLPPGETTQPQSPSGGGTGPGSPSNGYGDNGGNGGPLPGPAGAFSMYKPGQGYYTRLGTGIGAGLIAAFGANYLYNQMTTDNAVLHMGIPFAFLAVCGLIIYWVVGSNRRTNEFFIATEGEMKKVSWSTRREIIGSTKVVLLFTFLMAFLLFFVDVIFMFFFSGIGVLKMDPLSLFGLGG